MMRLVETPSLNFGERRGIAVPDMLVLHYTGMESAAASLARLCDPDAEVSAHYLIEEDGTAHRLVDDTARAWHAGRSYWRGITDVNSRSIGIEIQNPGHEYGYRAFPTDQIDAVCELCVELLQRHAIPPAGIVGHSDIAPDRKVDPGELFPWHILAQRGIGVFPGDGADTERSLDALLTDIGYDPDAKDRIAAFQRRFRPDRINGIADRECARLAAAYLSMTGEHAEPTGD